MKKRQYRIREADPQFWQWSTLGAAGLFLVECEFYRRVFELLPTQPGNIPVAAVLTTAGAAAVLTFLLASARRCKKARALASGSAAVTCLWLATAVVFALVWARQ